MEAPEDTMVLMKVPEDGMEKTKEVLTLAEMLEEIPSGSAEVLAEVSEKVPETMADSQRVWATICFSMGRASTSRVVLMEST